MKILRLIILIPAIIVVWLLASILFPLFWGIFYPYETELDLFSFLFRSFFEALFTTSAVVSSAKYIYPYKKKYPALIIVTIIHISMLMFFYFLGYYKYFYFTIKTIISLVEYTIGSVVMLGYFWKQTYADEIKSSK